MTRTHTKFFLGRPLNPTFPGFPSFDIKTFNEVRPGIILWVLVNISCACEQYVRFGHVTASMWLVLIFEGIYAADSLIFEVRLALHHFGATQGSLPSRDCYGAVANIQHTILHQMDITTDGFGFMLAFGDLTWVPFTYGLQARFLAFHPVHLGVSGTLAIVAVEALGLYIFRTSNSDKAAFRAGKNPKSVSLVQPPGFAEDTS